jgi:hypothetical protein
MRGRCPETPNNDVPIANFRELFAEFHRATRRLKVPLLRTGEFIQNLVVSKITTLQQLRLAG